VEAERHVIAEERARELDSPLGRLDQTILRSATSSIPTGIRLLGCLTTYAGDGRGFASFYHTHYRPDGAVLVVAGAVDPEPTLDRIGSDLRGLVRGEFERPRLPPASRARLAGATSRSSNRTQSRRTVRLAFVPLGIRTPALDVPPTS